MVLGGIKFMSTKNEQTSTVAADLARQPILRAQGISRSFQMGDSELQVLRDCDLHVRQGEFIAIEGRSGSGKSTLLHILGALDVADQGSVFFQGQDYTRRPPRHGRVRSWLTGRLALRLWILMLLAAPVLVLVWYIRRNMQLHDQFFAIAAIVSSSILVLLSLLYFIPRLWDWWASAPEERRAARMRNEDFGFVFQFYHLLPELDVLENVLLPSMIQFSWLKYQARRKDLRRQAKTVLTELGLGHRLGHKPQQLSGGERQRVAIARALMNNPRVLFADEPTGNLDFETGRQIMTVLEKLHQQRKQTIIMVTHDRALARTADRVLVLEEGRLRTVQQS